MAWEWSHTPEAYENAKKNLDSLSRETLEVIWAEWLTHNANPGGPFWDEAYPHALEMAKMMPKDSMQYGIWEYAERQRLCDNGGFRAWVCPFGCHTVPFSPTLNDEHRQFLNARIGRDLIQAAYDFRIHFELSESNAGDLIQQWQGESVSRPDGR